MNTYRIITVSALTFTTLFGACKKDSKKDTTYYGTPVAFGNGSVRTFLTVNSDGQNTSLGLRMTEESMNGLPTDTMPGMPGMPAPGAMIMLDLPAQAKGTGFDHAMVNWNVYGHDPKQVYGVPHFDFHFYQVAASEQNAIPGGTDVTAVDPKYIPQDYAVPVPTVVPMMGLHWFDMQSPEFHGMPFTSTFIYGSYHGKYIFLEPMITKAFFLSHPDFSAPVKQPAAYQTTGYSPSSYQLQFDDKQHEYVLTLNGLQKH